ncbi:MAG TPA: hypothetical protein VEA38_15565 [Terriglobales bacterium]|nr:hypothetical protein [Terriglobales bacterium]
MSVLGVTVACPCGEVYELKAEYAGRLLECPVCLRHVRAGRGPAAPRAAVPGVDRAFDRDVFLLRERVLTITSKYEVWAEDGTPIAYVERPTYPVRTGLAYIAGAIAGLAVLGWTARTPGNASVDAVAALVGWGFALAAFVVVSMSLRPRRHVTIYRDDSRGEVLLRILQDQRIAALVRTYTVTLADGSVLARLGKSYLHNLVRKRWTIADAAGAPLALAVEESIVLSLLRRVLGSLFGVLRTNFLFQRPDGEVLGEFNRKFTLLDRYVLDLSADAEGVLDRRIALTTGIMLDTGERR